MWTKWFCLGARVGRCGEKTAPEPARTGADQQDGVGGADTQAQQWHDQSRSPEKQGAVGSNGGQDSREQQEQSP